MDAVFLKILNMSITAGWLILVVAALRLILRRAPKWVSCALWALVAVRLLCPFSFESALSLIPSAETVSPDILYYQRPTIDSGISALNGAINPIISESLAPTVGASANPLQIWASIAAYAWLVGMSGMLICAAISYLRLRRAVRASLNVEENIWICDDIKTPFILGVIKPRIYLPSGIDEARRGYVVAHERAHLARRDHLWKLLGYALLTVYWFNPLSWLAYTLLCRDIELACDERVAGAMDTRGAIAYSEALLALSAPHGALTACPLAFAEVGVSERIKSILNYKKPAFWVIAAALAVCAVTAVCFLTNPKKDTPVNWAERPMLIFDGASYVDPYMPVSEPPYGYALAGELSEEQAGNTNLSGCKYYTNPADGESFYVYEQCGTPIDINTVDSEKLQWAYKRWVKMGAEGGGRLLTLDDARMLAKKSEALTWSDFDLYEYTETGSGLYIRVYYIDELFSVWIGGSGTKQAPVYIYLRVDSIQYQTDNDYVDMRSGDVEAFIAAHKNDTPSSRGEEGGALSAQGESAETLYDIPSLAWPVPGFETVSSSFGRRTLYGQSDYHAGIDVAGSGINGADVVAAESGVVVSVVSYDPVYGSYIVVNHGGGYETLYACLSSTAVEEGESVEKGQVIAAEGSSGEATGPHLHFELRLDGATIDPMGALD